MILSLRGIEILEEENCRILSAISLVEGSNRQILNYLAISAARSILEHLRVDRASHARRLLMNPTSHPPTVHSPKTPVEKRANRQIWIVTIITSGVILLIALGFLIMRYLGSGVSR